MSLNGKVAVVTGAGSGIGRAIAVRLAKDGAAIAIWDINETGAQETADLIGKAGGKARAYHADAASAASIQAALAATHKDLGATVTILVNNAGMTGFTPLLEIADDHWDRMMAINLKGPFLCVKAIIPDMLKAGWGRIVNITSSSTQSGSSNMAHYVSSKAGLLGFTRAVATEYAAHGITSNAIPPGFIDTPMLRASPVNVDQYAASMPMRRAGKPEDIAGACSYLCSDDAGYVTGQTISVNGGRYYL
jgi:2-hydroxycyclohexanecarboxyl-CoA dehydrogenase